ncbi:hypothetical protein BJK06_16850 [Curtobacterium sp. BH-2-1-1]|uniref:DUF805 domain-containing protein n=1 Tax=Curtobacterium sp. BH-2-1-1 TaxID=1905847 RepID=UPI00089DE0D0|nr:DUF805 domain-containing protein [Curtobacterium sp. BH-2-1-1]AOX67162.1 hypothetical protein BJK06_16850 [Curtobacterium sp. BH-2-1-1]
MSEHSERIPPTGMDLPDAVRTVARKAADFRGRAARPEFWWFILFSAVVGTALGAANVVTPAGTVMVGSALSGVWSVVVFVPTLAVTVRRLRDAGRRWQNVFWLLLPFVGLILLIVRLCEPSVGATTNGLTGPSTLPLDGQAVRH